MSKVDFSRCPTKPVGMKQSRYEDLCHLFAESGYDFAKFEKQADNLNKSAGIIRVCHNCGKVDISPLSHWRECNPASEAARQQNQEVYWR